jgi:hypothetical protein
MGGGVFVGRGLLRRADENDDLSVLDTCYGIPINRTSGFVRKVGVFEWIPVKRWMEAKPQRELIFLI